jgi:hypothetical protein
VPVYPGTDTTADAVAPEEALLEVLNESSRHCAGSASFCASPPANLAAVFADDVDRLRGDRR